MTETRSTSSASSAPTPAITTVAGTDMVLWITYINIVLYALCYQLQRPVEPFLVQSLSENHNDPTQVALMYSRLQSFFSAIQTVGSPLVGILLDRVGVRHASALVFLASAMSYAILASASTMPLLFLSKVPTVLQHAFLVAQAAAAISTGTNAAARAQALGRMTTAYTIGGTIGPALGGFLVETMGDLYLGAKLAVVGSLVSVVLSLMFLPSKTVAVVDIKNPTAPVPAHKLPRSFLEALKHSFQLALRPNLWPLLLVKVIGGFAASMHSTALPLVLVQYLHFDPSQLGISMSTSMFAVAAFGAIAMAPLAAPNVLGPSGMGRVGLLLRAGLASVLAVIVTTAATSSSSDTSESAPSSMVTRVVIASVLHALASHVLATGLTTQTTGVVSKSEQGALLGLEHGLFSMARIGAPPLASHLLVHSGGGFWTVALFCGAVDVSLVGLLLATKKQQNMTLLGTAKADEEHSD
jgi:OCT family organic cation transporter-like MFS transporter 18